MGVVAKISGKAFCFVLMNQKQVLHSSQSNQSGNQTVRWILHDITFHPELCARGFSKIHCTMIWAFPYCFRFFFRRFLPFVGWFPCPSQMGSAQVLRSGTFRHLKTLSDVGLRQLCEGTYHTLLQGLCGEVPSRGWIDRERPP